LDKYFEDNGKTAGPLHGLPISLKDQLHVKGIDTSMGYVGWIGANLGVEKERTHQVESQLTTDLLALGAVLYCKVRSSR
jgi:amidase